MAMSTQDSVTIGNFLRGVTAHMFQPRSFVAVSYQQSAAALVAEYLPGFEAVHASADTKLHNPQKLQHVADPPASLNIGSPVTVFARTLDRVSGVVLPKSALTTAASGETLVWVHTEPERFLPRAVKVRAIDGARVFVEAGLEAGERVVTAAAELVNQVR